VDGSSGRDATTQSGQRDDEGSRDEDARWFGRRPVLSARTRRVRRASKGWRPASAGRRFREEVVRSCRWSRHSARPAAAAARALPGRRVSRWRREPRRTGGHPDQSRKKRPRRQRQEAAQQDGLQARPSRPPRTPSAPAAMPGGTSGTATRFAAGAIKAKPTEGQKGDRQRGRLRRQRDAQALREGDRAARARPPPGGE